MSEVMAMARVMAIIRGGYNHMSEVMARARVMAIMRTHAGLIIRH